MLVNRRQSLVEVRVQMRGGRQISSRSGGAPSQTSRVYPSLHSRHTTSSTGGGAPSRTSSFGYCALQRLSSLGGGAPSQTFADNAAAVQSDTFTSSTGGGAPSRTSSFSKGAHSVCRTTAVEHPAKPSPITLLPYEPALNVFRWRWSTQPNQQFGRCDGQRSLNEGGGAPSQTLADNAVVVLSCQSSKTARLIP